jgi:hypothetical protein
VKGLDVLRPNFFNSDFEISAFHHPLRDKAKAALLDRLGNIEKGAEAIHEVEKWLGFYPVGVRAFDKAPRAVDYLETLKPISKRANKLYNDLNKLNPWITSAIEIRGIYAESEALGHSVDIDALKISLHALIDAAENVISEKGQTESRGRPKGETLRIVVGQLRRIFARYYRGGNSLRSTRGAINPLSEREYDEQEFIEIALKDANIPCPQNIRSLFDEPRVALPHERNKVLEKIARQHRKADQKKPSRKQKPSRKLKRHSRH